MCGVVGLLAHGRGMDGPIAPYARRMADTLIHRGPDDTGVWVDEAAGIALGHRRLSILDLSEAGHQPMTSSSGRYVIAFNGEIYNHAEIREQLACAGAKTSWRGHSDTETLLEAIEHCGLKAALRQCIGMFAIALWDRNSRKLTLACDRTGEKPLYYGIMDRAVLFGSELKALRLGPDFDDSIDRDALALYMRHNYVPGPFSIFRKVKKVPPATIIEFLCDADTASPTVDTYWSFREIAQRGLGRIYTGSDDTARIELEQVLRCAIAGQMIADVPLGAFLSGGVDSTTVVALMQTQSSRPVRTFTIGFHESSFDEAHYARAVANHLGTDHTELFVTPTDALNIIPQLPEIYDEPFADSSQIPTYLVAKLARQHVTVSLSGDAGDELFGGYNRYFWARDLWSRISMLPAPMSRALGKFLVALPQSRWDQIFRWLAPATPERLRVARPGEKVHKIASMLAASSSEAVYHDLVSHWSDPADLVLESKEPTTPVTDRSAWLECPDFESRMMYMDSITYLPYDILVKVDRAAMAASLETRVPMLDHRVIEFAWQLPLHMKIRNGESKWLLRQVLYSHVPRGLIDRPKMGFGVPIGDWLRGPLRDWAESLLDPSRLERENFFRPQLVRAKWDDHLAGRRDWQYHLWDVLMFQTWRERWQSGIS